MTIISNSKYRLFPSYISPILRKSISALPLERTDTHLVSPCPFTDCSFDADNMCYYVSNDQLRDDEDLLLGIFYPRFFCQNFFRIFLDISLYQIFPIPR